MGGKILFVANIHKHFKAFHIPYIQLLQSYGYEVHVAANDNVTKINVANKQFNIPIDRSPLSVDNIKAIKQLKKIIINEDYTLIHCHTAMGAFIARLAAISSRKNKNLKVLYTCHGFHFYKNGPIKYWLIFFPIEKFLSKFTDGIVTINKEDFEVLEKYNFKANKSFLIPGIGVEPKKFKPVDLKTKLNLRKENNLEEKDFVIVYAAEYIYRKNHKFLVDSAKELHKQIPNFKLLLAGRGELFEDIQSVIEEQNLTEKVIQLGFRKDIDLIYKMADLGVSSSREEGLGLNLVEEMMCGLPIVATEDRGHKEVVDHGLNGFLFPQNSNQKFVSYVVKLYKDKSLLDQCKLNAIQKAKKFELQNSLKEMKEIYKEYLNFNEPINKFS